MIDHSFLRIWKNINSIGFFIFRTQLSLRGCVGSGVIMRDSFLPQPKERLLESILDLLQELCGERMLQQKSNGRDMIVMFVDNSWHNSDICVLLPKISNSNFEIVEIFRFSKNKCWIYVLKLSGIDLKPSEIDFSWKSDLKNAKIFCLTPFHLKVTPM